MATHSVNVVSTKQESEETIPSLKSTPHLPGWRVTLNQRRMRVYPHGNIVSDKASRHVEQKKRLKKGEHLRTTVEPYDNGMLVPWQKEFAQSLNKGHNIIVGSVTSTGKTWIGNLAVAHETLERDNVTSLIISPNSAVMRDTVQDIETFHTKRYQYSTSMVSTMTRRFQNYDLTRNGPPGQIMVISVESAVDFMTNPVNKYFVDKLRFIVFDEVHMPSVSEALWWSQHIPHTAQLVLLSATLGDPLEVQKIVDTMQGNDPKRPQTTTIFTRDVRPIPLQLLTFKGCDKPEGGVRSKHLKKVKALSCMINPHDPTVRDLQSILGVKHHIPEDRDSQFELGKDTMRVDEYMDIVKTKNASAIADANTDLSAENIYKLLCCLKAKDMLPAMVFNTTTEQTKAMAEALIGYIDSVERSDPEYTKARSVYDTYETAKHRARDADISKRDGGKKTSKELNDWDKPLPEERMPKGVNIHEIENTLQKWRFPCDYKHQNARGVEQWILDCLEYGIGVYVASMKAGLRHKIFDAVRTGKIRVLFSDSSISVGINLPIRTVVVCGPVPHDLFIQAGGRAGRRGLDDRGYIVQLMPTSLIEKYTYKKQADVTLRMPQKMPFTSLIRLQVPSNLSSVVEPDVAGIRKFSEREAAYVNAYHPNTPSNAIDPYHTTVLENYMSILSDAEEATCRKQIELLHKEQWQYHRLTNLIKMIPEESSILLVKLMVVGKLKDLTSQELMNLLSMLLFRVEAPEDIDVETLENEYYVPDFSQSKIPELSKALQSWSKKYGIDIDFEHPIHRYVTDFCYRGKHHLKYMKELESFKEWLYILKANVLRCAPASRGGYKDNTSDLLYKADSIYMAACCRRDMEAIMSD